MLIWGIFLQVRRSAVSSMSDASLACALVKVVTDFSLHCFSYCKIRGQHAELQEGVSVFDLSCGPTLICACFLGSQSSEP